MTDCLFCRIAAREIDAAIVEDEGAVLAFRDINPQAPTHVLVIPRDHIESADALTDEHRDIWVAMLRLTRRIARDQNIDRSGYRLVANVGADGGQTVPHLHVHLLGGRQMSWPPG